MHEADLPTDRPPDRWSDVVTKDDLDARSDAFVRHINAQFDLLHHEWKSALHHEMMLQTRQLIGAFSVLLAIFVAAIRL